MPGASWNPATGDGSATTFDAVVRTVATNKGLINDPFAQPLVRAAGVEYFTWAIDDERYVADDGDNPITTGLIYVQAAYGRLTTVYELDRPEVLDFKSEVLCGLAARPTANRRPIGVDLRQDWLAALRRVGFDAAQPTVWIAEQLLVGCLPADAPRRLLQDVTRTSTAGIHFTADYDGWRRHGLDVEPASLMYPDEYRYVPEYLATHGWQTVERNVVELFATLGLAESWRGRLQDVDLVPGYVTAIRPGMLPGNKR